MLPEEPHPRWWLHASRAVLPDEVQTLLLKACFLQGDDATAAWHRFSMLTGEPQRYFENALGGLKGLLPYVESRLASRGVRAAGGFRTYARVALVREALRADIYEAILATLLEQMHKRRLACVLLKGAALSRTVYPEGAARHNHGIDLLVHEADMNSARSAVLAASCSQDPIAGPYEAFRYFVHSTGLSVSLQTRLFDLPYLSQSVDTLWQHTILVKDDIHLYSVLSPEFGMLHTLGNAALNATRTNLRWVCDCWHILERTPQFDWRAFCDAAVETGLALPVYTMLGYLHDAFAAPVPAWALLQLEANVEARVYSDRKANYAFLLSLEPLRTSKGVAPRWPATESMGILRFRVLPPPSYLRWRYQTRGVWRILALYVQRPLNWLLRLIRKPKKQDRRE